VHVSRITNQRARGGETRHPTHRHQRETTAPETEWLGNRATSLLLQAKMQVGPAGDAYEREADRVAAQVVARLSDPHSAGPDQVRAGGSVQRTGGHDAGFDAPEHVVDGIERSRGGGRPLGEATRDSMQHAFGADLSGVRIHDDANADHLARSVQARAFTTGNDIYFRSGEYAPASPSGQHVLAHELTHTLQQAGGVQRTIQRFSITENPPKLSEATSIKRAGSGQTGAFLLWQGSQGLAVKFHDENPGRVLFAEQVMTDNGISTPGTRAFPGSTLLPELSSAWMNLSGSLGKDAQAGGWKLLETFAKEPWALVMNMNQGATMNDQADKTSDPDQALLDLWSDPHLLMSLGELIVVDSFLGNADRLGMLRWQGGNDDSRDIWMNAGNWMVDLQQGEHARLETLDNDSMLGAFDEMTNGQTVDDIRMWVRKNIQGDVRLSDNDARDGKHNRNLAGVEALFDPDKYLGFLEKYFQESHKIPASLRNVSWNLTGRYLRYGMDNARQRIMANLDKYMAMMSQLHSQGGSDGAFDQQAMQDRIDFLKMRQDGATDDEALETLEVGALGHTGILATILADLLVFDPTWEQVTREPGKGGLLKRAKRKMSGGSDQMTGALGNLDAALSQGTWTGKKFTYEHLDGVLQAAANAGDDGYASGRVRTKAELLRGLKQEHDRAEALKAATAQIKRVNAKLGDDGRAGQIAGQTASAAEGIMGTRDPAKPLVNTHVAPLFGRFTTTARAATGDATARTVVGVQFAAFSQELNAFNTEWTRMVHAQARRAMAARNARGGSRRRPARV